LDCHGTLLSPPPLGSVHFLEEGVDRRNPGEGHEIFACPQREGQHKFDTTKSCRTINFIAYRGRVTFFSTKNMTGGLGDFTFMLIGIPPAHPPPKK